MPKPLNEYDPKLVKQARKIVEDCGPIVKSLASPDPCAAERLAKSLQEPIKSAAEATAQNECDILEILCILLDECESGGEE